MTDETPMDSPIDQPLAPSTMPDGQQISASTKSSLRVRDHHAQDRLLHSRGAVLSFLFLVAGIVGLPLLWVNPNFSRRERVFWTVIMLLYSFILVVLFGGMLWWIYRLIIGA